MEITKDEESSTKNKRSNKDNQRCGMKKQPPMIKDQSKITKIVK